MHAGQMLAPHLEYLIQTMVSEGAAFYEPPRQSRSVIVCWKKADEWAETLFSWVRGRDRVSAGLTPTVETTETHSHPSSTHASDRSYQRVSSTRS